MSIINEALKKAREKRDRCIRESQKLLMVPPPKEVVRQGGVKTEAPKYSGQKPDVLVSNEQLVLRHILFTIGAIVLISFTLFIIVRQSRNYTINRSLAKQGKYEAPPEPLKTIPQQISVAESRAILPETPEFMLTGIVSDEESPMAIINGEVYVVGDRVKTAKVLEISENVVVLEKDGERIELKVK